MHQRRLVILALGAGLSGHTALLRAQTPATGPRRVGVLAPSTRAKEEVTLKHFFVQMREMGWIEGQNIVYGTLVFNLRGRLIELANRRRLPVIGSNQAWVEAGALFNYGASQDEQMRRSAQLVDKILKGAKPADIPVEQPTKFELVINLKAARALGITVPQNVLLRADEVIQ